MSEILSPASILGQSHASDRGVHYWGQFHGCPYRRVLDERLKEQVQAGTQDDERLDAYQAAMVTPGKINMRNVGTLFHKLCELYYTDQLSKVTWEYAGEDDPIDWKEACRLFRAYRDKFPVNEFGAVFASEWAFEFGAGASAPRQECFEEFGVPRFTGRIDLLPMVLADNLSLVRELLPNAPLLYPGVYILDFKVRGRDTTYLREQYLDSIQLQLYMHAWDVLHPDQKCQGAIISLVIPRPPVKSDPDRLPELRSYLVPAPTEESYGAARAYLKTGYELREALGVARANRNECWRYEYNPCPHHPLMGGTCNLKGE